MAEDSHLLNGIPLHKYIGIHGMNCVITRITDYKLKVGLNELFFVECCVSFVGAPWMVHKRLFPGGVLEIQKVV